jgi:hypothetical protein
MAPRWDWIAMGCAGLALAVALQGLERKTQLEDDKERLRLQIADFKHRESQLAEARRQLVQTRAWQLAEMLCSEQALCELKATGSGSTAPAARTGSGGWFRWRRRTRSDQPAQGQGPAPREAPREQAGASQGFIQGSSNLSAPTATADTPGLQGDSVEASMLASPTWLPVLAEWYEGIERGAPECATRLKKKSDTRDPTDPGKRPAAVVV